MDNFVAQQYGKNYLAAKDGRYRLKKLRTKNASELQRSPHNMKEKTAALQKVVAIIGEQHSSIYGETCT